jgi:hypothetical protein
MSRITDQKAGTAIINASEPLFHRLECSLGGHEGLLILQPVIPFVGSLERCLANQVLIDCGIAVQGRS